MGQTIPGGYYKTIDGKFRDANGNLVDEMSDKDREKAASDAPQTGETGVTPSDPGPLGPSFQPNGEDASKNVEKSMEKEGVRGGKTEKSSGKK